MLRAIAAAAFFLLVSFQIQAALDPELNKPYHLIIVLHVKEHPLLTRNDVFTDRLKQELRDALQRDLGSAATVEINATGKHPLLNEVLQKGWSALDKPHPADQPKTHFVMVDYVDGQYEVQARQVCGSTGLVSILRRERTPDRLWLSRLAALTVAQDFGVIGTLEEKETIGKAVRLKIKASELGDSPALKVSPGDVLALSLIRQMPDNTLRGVRVPDTLLYVTESRDGEFVARRFDRFQIPPRSDRATLGYRAIKLGTRQAPLRLRVINQKTGEPVAGCAVAVSAQGFETGREEIGATDNQGRIRSPKLYRNVAFVWLTVLQQPRAQAPVPLLEDQVIEFPIAVTKDVEELARLQYVFGRWRSKVGDTGVQLKAQVEEINLLDDQGKTQESAKKAQDLAEALKDDLGRYRAEFDQMRKESGGAGPQAKRLIDEGDRLLATLAHRHKGVLEYIQLLENPTPAQKYLRQARLKLASDTPEAALDLFRQSLKADANQPQVAATLKRLEEGWRDKNPRHKQAKQFVDATWAKAGLEDQDKKMNEAKAYLTGLQAAGDILTIRKMQRVNEKHAAALESVLNQIGDVPTPEEREKAQLVAKVAEGLAELETIIQKFLDSERGQ